MLRRRAVVTAYRPRPPIHVKALAITIAAATLLSVLMWIRHSDCLVLVVWSSREKYELLDELVNRYDARRVDRRCVKVDVELVASGAAEERLAEWQDERRGRPHIWSPASNAWLLLLQENRRRNKLPDIVPAVAQSLIQSPTVIGMPEPMEAVLRADRPRIGWDDISELAQDPMGWSRFGKPWGPVRLVKTTPENSTSGLHALISLNNVAQSAADRRRFLQGSESGVAHYPDSVNAYLQTLYRLDAQGKSMTHMSAMAVEEKQIFDYNRGNPTGRPCVQLCGPEPTVKLKAVYPKGGTLIANHPYAILNWPDQADGALYRQAASEFQDYLEGDAVQRYFQSQGFRNHRGEAGAILAAPYFEGSEPVATYTVQVPRAIRDTLDEWRDGLRKRANAFLVLDVNGLDQQIAPGTTKLDLVKRAMNTALANLASNDAIGLRIVPSASVDVSREVQPRAPLGPAPTQLSREIDQLRTENGRPTLYAAMKAAADSVRAAYARDRVNALVVITEGVPNDGAGAHFDLMLSLREQPIDRRVLIFVVALSTSARADLQAIADESGGLYYDASEVAGIAGAIRNALLNL